MNPRLLLIAPLILGSGFCALIYQMVWLREFRLFFGASTAATAAVLAIFMGGLGFGSAILGRRSESKARPLRFYAKLELMIAVSAALTPALIWLMRQIYLALGGTLTMGLGLGTLIRLLMSVLVLGLPTFLMGGTLPALARAVVGQEDTNRRPVALLYGINTLGAVMGTAAATFYFFEAWGNRLTLALAAAFNVWVALRAFQISKDLPAIELSEPKPEEHQAQAAPPPFVFAASAIAGFAFLLMEMVWYRMLCSLLGASTFTFGLILAIALFGIGLGGLIYWAWFGGRRITLITFAFVCALEALCLALPYALGDRVALIAMLLRPLGVLGFYGFVAGWAAVCAIVVLPAAIVSGVQFPMLIALLGKGRTQVGAHTGITYAWNTVGAIAGSLAGGFGFLPLFSAPGVWRMVVVLLSGLALAAVLIHMRREQQNVAQIFPAVGTAVLALFLLAATGPTAFWRHSEIGVGRMARFNASKNEVHDLMNTVRRDILWDKDGVESSVALSKKRALNFIVNGRCDGSIKVDAGTQIMLGLVPAILHPHPARALVIGLGTGSTAGWLAAVPAVEQVDVFELEPAILKVAEQCAAMNQATLANPKVHVTIGDGREMLLAGREKYDLIVSEPSNPYRAGIASLFTREYYQAAAKRLNSEGIFAQWIQAYEVDDSTIETVYATFGSVFPNVETWQTQSGDLLLVGTSGPRTYNADELRSRIADEPFRTALLQTWRVTTLEGFLSHFVAGNGFATSIQRLPGVHRNTDDRTVLEFAFARNVDLSSGFRPAALRLMADLMQVNRIPISKGDVNWSDVGVKRLSMLLSLEEMPNPDDYASGIQSTAAAYAAFLKGDLVGALRNWRAHPREPNDLNELLMMAECSANEGTPETDAYLEKLRELLPNEADAIRVSLLLHRGKIDEAAELLATVLQRLHTDPWLSLRLAERTLVLAQRMVDHISNDSQLNGIYEALRTPFSVAMCDALRVNDLVLFGGKLDKGQYGKYTFAAIEPQEPFVPWQGKFLKIREACYKAMKSPLSAQASRDVNDFFAREPSRLSVIRPPTKTTPTETAQPTSAASP